jgi:hypothetical protein
VSTVYYCRSAIKEINLFVDHITPLNKRTRKMTTIEEMLEEANKKLEVAEKEHIEKYHHYSYYYINITISTLCPQRPSHKVITCWLCFHQHVLQPLHMFSPRLHCIFPELDVTMLCTSYILANMQQKSQKPTLSATTVGH